MRKIIYAGLAVAIAACAEPIAVGPSLDFGVRYFRAAVAPAVVAPSGYAGAMGTVNNNFPHSFRNLRYQQVFLGTDLVDPTVVGLCLRRDDEAGGAERVQTLRVRLGPTALDYTSLGRVFDENYSAPATEVFSGDVTIPASEPGGTPADFDVCISFTQSYEHPQGSNFIVEVINTSIASGNVPRDACAEGEAQCTTSRAYAFSAAASTAFSVQRGGLIMKFISPEPPRPLDPLTGEECRNGGWSNFAFRNQGQCIRFIETGYDSRP